jgi:hypothetical protein
MTGFFDRLAARANAPLAPVQAIGLVEPDDVIGDDDGAPAPVIAAPSAPAPDPASATKARASNPAPAAPADGQSPVARPSPPDAPITTHTDPAPDVAVPEPALSRESRETADTPAARLADPFHARADPAAPPPIATQTPLRRFIDRIAAENATPEPFPLSSPPPAVRAPSPPPQISIGHIEIIVAPPPLPPLPRAPVSAAPRNAGFAGYARVRRGLER